MKFKTSRKTLSAAIGTAVVAGFAASPVVLADSNPFAVTELSSGYMVAGKGEGEGKCGGKGEAEGSCGADSAKTEGEGSCGGAAGSTKTEGEGSCGAAGEKQAAKGSAEGKCGEGSCGS